MVCVKPSPTNWMTRFFWADFLDAVRFFLGKSNIVQVCSSLPHNPWIKSKLKRQKIHGLICNEKKKIYKYNNQKIRFVTRQKWSETLYLFVKGREILAMSTPAGIKLYQPSMRPTLQKQSCNCRV